ncbi:MAG: hypothetical protein PHO27_03125 [Sulfuricurvum sp.]|nr:hypothetical protein [Sulfuricurvum sp.]
MDIQNRLIARSAELIDQNSIRFDFDVFLQRLLLFETYILDSIRLKEIPYLIDCFGYEGLIKLLDANIFKIQATANSIGQIGQTFLRHNQGREILPLGSFSFSSIKSADDKKYVSDCLKITDEIPKISTKQKIKLKHSIIDNLTRLPNDFGNKSIEQMKSEILRKEIVKKHLSRALMKIYGFENISKQLDVTVHQLSEDDFLVESNIESKFGLNKENTHKVIETSLLSIGTLNQKIEEMKFHNALSGFMGNEIPLFEDKLAFLERDLSPQKTECQMQRILEIKDFPKIDTIGSIDVEKLLEIRQSNECKLFRMWLKQTDSLNDDEISDEINNYREKMASLVNSTSGKTIRWGIGVGMDLLPFGGSVYGALDTFLIDKLLPQKGHIVFINDLYPSIFKT